MAIYVISKKKRDRKGKVNVTTWYPDFLIPIT